MCATDPTAHNGGLSEFSIVDWASRKLPRVCRSSLACEAQSATLADGETMIMRLLLKELLSGRVDLQNPEAEVHQVPATMITDCKGLFDGIEKIESAGLGSSDRRVSIELLALRQSFRAPQTKLRWVHSHAQVADGLTNASYQALNVLRSFMVHQRWKIIHDEHFLSARKSQAAGKDIFDGVNDDDRGKADAEIDVRRKEYAARKAELGTSAISFPFSTDVNPSMLADVQTCLFEPKELRSRLGTS